MTRTAPGSMDRGAFRGIVNRVRANPAPLLLTLVVVAFYSPVVLFGRVFYLKDAQLVVYPTRLFLRQRLLAFDLPEWLPHLDLGMPFLANPSNGVLYPLNLLLLLPAPWCVGLFVVSHALIAILGAWGLLRALGVQTEASVLGAMAFALGGYMVSLTWVPNYMMSLAWLPAVALMALRSLRTGRLADAGLTGLVWALQILSGEPQGVVLTGWFVAALGLGFPARPGQKWRQLCWLCFGALIAVCVSLPQVLPALELIPRSRRALGIQLSEASHWSLHPLRLLELLVPNLFGNPLHFDEFLGFFLDDENSALHRDPWMVTPYLGSAVMLLAIVGLAATRTRHRWWVRSLAVLLGLSLLLAIGRHSPLFALYFQYVPAARLFRYPAKIFGLAAAILPLLGAAGFDAWRSHRQMRLPRYGALVITVVLLAGLAIAPHAGRALHELRPAVTVEAATHTLRQALSIELGLIALISALLALGRRRAGRIIPLGLLGVAAIQIVRANLGAYATAPSQVYSEPPLARRIRGQTPPGEPTRVMHEVAALDIAGLNSADGAVQAQAITHSLMKDIGVAFEIGYADSYLSSEEGAKFEFWRNLGPFRRQMLDVFGVRHLVLSTNVLVGAGSGLRPLDGIASVGAAVYENPHALPFAYAVGSVVFVQGQADAQVAMRDPRVARGLVAVVDGSAPETPPAVDFERVGTCHLLAPLGDRIDLACDLRKAGYAIVNASHHPNFTARLDGVPVSILRANAFVMATRVSAGTHRLSFEYSEPSFVPAATASFFACVLCWLLVHRESRRSSRHAERRSCPETS